MAKDLTIGSEQLELDLHDKELFLDATVKQLKEEISGNQYSTLVILSSVQENMFYLGIRTFYYETDYERRLLITKDQALYLCDKHEVNPFLSRNKLYQGS